MQHVWARLRPSMGVLVAAGVVVVAAGGLGAPAAAATGDSAAADGHVTVVHGVRGLLADVSVDGKSVLSSFSPERVTDPLALPAGRHTVQVRRHGDTTGAPIVTGTLTVPAGAHLTVAVGLTRGGGPVMTAYRDDDLGNLVSSDTGSAVVVRDVADAPKLKVTVDRAALAPVISPRQADTTVSAGTHAVAVHDASTGTTLFPPTQVPTQAGTVTALYLIGSTGDHSLDWLAQTIRVTRTGVERSPVRVETGNSGLAAAPPARAAIASGGSIGLAGSTGLSAAVLLAVTATLTVSRRDRGGEQDSREQDSREQASAGTRRDRARSGARTP